MKLWRIIFLLLLTVVLVACSNDRENNEATNTDETNENKAEEESGIEVDKGIFDVEITLPASLFGEEELEDIENEIQESTDADITLNDDGSITVNMSKSDHKKMLNEMSEEIEKQIDEMVQDEDFASIQDIEYNKNFSQFKMVVNDESSFKNSFDSFAILSLGFSGMLYQAFDGKDLTKHKVTIEIFDASTNEVIHEIVYPDAFEEIEE